MVKKNKPIKICLFLTYEGSLKKWDEAGILDREASLYEDLIKQGARVAFFTYGNKDDYKYKERFPDIEIIPAYAKIRKFKNRKLAFFQSLWLPIIFRKTLRNYEIYKTNQMWGGWVALVAKFVCGGKLLARCGFEHYYVLLADKFPFKIRWWFYLISKTVYFFADQICLTSEHSANFVEKKFGIPRKKISVYSNFIDTDIFKPKPPLERIEKRVFFIGRLNKEKNIFLLIKACKKANFGLDLIGRGELQEELSQYAKKINADVRFLGVYENNQLPDLIVRYPMFVLPSIWEGNPKSLLEAMSCGKAVIGTNVPGIKEIIKHNENGLLCEPSADAIADAVLSLSDNPNLRQFLGENARKYVLENSSLKDIVKTELKIYSQIEKKPAKVKSLLLHSLIRQILKLHNLFYGLAGLLSIKLESNNVHPKHRILDYHRWFINQIKPHWHVLDIGCGNGSLTADLANYCNKVTGIDISPENIKLAKSTAIKVEFICDDATTHNFDKKFDAIILSNILEHIEDRTTFLKKLLKQSDRFLIRVPMIDRDWITLYKREMGVEYRLDKTHAIEYTFNEFAKELKDAGLIIESHRIRYGEIYAVAIAEK